MALTKPYSVKYIMAILVFVTHYDFYMYQAAVNRIRLTLKKGHAVTVVAC